MTNGRPSLFSVLRRLPSRRDLAEIPIRYDCWFASFTSVEAWILEHLLIEQLLGETSIVLLVGINKTLDS